MFTHEELPQDHVCIDFCPEEGAPEEGYAIQVSAAGRFSVKYDVHEDLEGLVVVDKATGLITCATLPFSPDFQDSEDGKREERANRDSCLIRLVPCPTGGPHVHVQSVNHPDDDDLLFLRGIRPRLEIQVLSIGSVEELEEALVALDRESES